MYYLLHTIIVLYYTQQQDFARVVETKGGVGMTTQPRIHGRYRVDGRLGATRIATVYRVYDDKLHRPVLLNLMRNHLVEQRSLRERFIADSELRARNVHSALPEVYDSGVIEDRPFFITEFITGNTLRQMLPLSGLMALQYLKQIIGVVQACQQSKIPHPPISSNDFIVVSEGHVKWIENWQLSPSEALIDIASYRAPERKEGHAETEASIVYAIGVLLFEMMSGMRPFPSDDPDTITQAHETTDIPPVSTVMADTCPPQIEELILRCTSRNPSYRLRDCAELMDIVAQVRRELLIEANLPVNTTPFPEGNNDTTAAAIYTEYTEAPPRPWGRMLLTGMILLVALAVGVFYGPGLITAAQNGTLMNTLTTPVMNMLPQKIIMPSWLDNLINGTNTNDAQILVVNGDNKLALHSDPDQESPIVTEIGAGSRVVWVDGPQTADGTAWLRVAYTNTADNTTIEGWAPQQRLMSPLSP